jgi:hypothetical protein
MAVSSGATRGFLKPRGNWKSSQQYFNTMGNSDLPEDGNDVYKHVDPEFGEITVSLSSSCGMGPEQM